MHSSRMSLQACVPLFLILQITLTCSPPFCHWSRALENTPLNLRLRLSSWTSPWSADKTVPTIGKFVTNYHRFFHDVVTSHVFAPLQLHNGGFLESYCHIMEQPITAEHNFPAPCDWSRKLAPTSQTTDTRLKEILTCVTPVSRPSANLLVFIWCRPVFFFKHLRDSIGKLH